jgi:hypothetical protein
LPKNIRSYKTEKRRKELKRQEKKEKKLAKRLEKSKFKEQEEGISTDSEEQQENE